MPANADLQVNSDHCLINKQNKFVVLTLSPCIGSGGGWGGVGSHNAERSIQESSMWPPAGTQTPALGQGSLVAIATDEIAPDSKY